MNDIITLISDWRLRDPYVAMLKGKIRNYFPKTEIVDITHYTDKFDTLQTAFILKNSFSSFSEGSIHLILTNTTFSSSFEPVLFIHNEHFFIGDDNGVFFMMFGEDTQLSGFKLNVSSGSSISDMFKIIENIKNNTVNENLSVFKNFKRMFVQYPEYSSENRRIEGQIVYIDAFNNAITDISADKFKKMVGNRPFSAIVYSNGDWTIEKFSNNYQSLNNEMFLTENGLGFIEIASYQSDVSIIADLKPYDRIVITY